MESKWRDGWKLYENLKLGYNFYWSNLKVIHILWCYDFSLRYMSFLAFALDNSSCFCSWLIEDYHERGQSKYILRKFETSAS